MKRENISLLLYTFAHFAVDFACANLIFRINGSFFDGALLMLTYNFCAFAVQLPLGVILDKLGRNALAAAVGCLLTGAAYLLGSVPMAAAVVCGLGNAAFHLGGGIDVLNGSEKAAPSGVFVSSGAVGLFLGTLCAKSGAAVKLPVLSVLCLSAVGIVLLRKRLFGDLRSENAEFSLPEKSVFAWGALALLFLVVLLRSFAGFGMGFSWKTGFGALLAVSCAAFGKFFGGFASDKMGSCKASAVSLGAAALLCIFGDNIVCGALAILTFNMTMPITLRKAADICGGCKGFSFGLMTFGLFCGFIPVYAENSLSLSPLALCLLCLASLDLLFAALCLAKRGRSGRN